ncbi:MAG: epoxyqueuosine reductase [Oscillospiraceae bacterium]|nr:epoxyqueuosine reductase [Oscillospiraceae bacterium]
MINKTLAQEIYDNALECGFDNCGIIPLSDLDGYKQRLDERKKKVPQSEQFYNAMDGFTKIQEQYPWAKAIIICTTWIGKYRYPESLQGKYAKAFFLSPESAPDSKANQDKIRFETWMTENNICWEGGKKYGALRNFPLRHAAVKAGLGIFRKNNFFYTEKGSYVELEGYIIDKECVLKQTTNIRACSESCTLCQKACKTHALCAPYTMNPMACISFWTTYGQGQIPPHLEENQFSDWICGCDDCQDACPNNMRHDWTSGEAFPGLDDIIELAQPENILKASDDSLCKHIIPKTVEHISPENINTLRVCAKRVLKQSGSK